MTSDTTTARRRASGKLGWLVEQKLVRSWSHADSAAPWDVEVVTADGKVHLWRVREVLAFWTGVVAERTRTRGNP